MENKNFAFGGITRSIGGAVCADGDLHTAVDVCNDGVGLQLLEKPRELFELADGETLLCIHEPEGEEKHYITQIIVVSGNDNSDAAPEQEEEDVEDSEEEPSVLEPAAPIAPYNPYITPEEPEEPPTVDSNSEMEVVPSIVPPESVDFSVADYTTAEAAKADNDNGGTVYAPQSGNALSEPTTQGIYLLWRKDNGNGTSTIMQTIDITAFGKVTAVQPMGNTLICNHEGVEGSCPAEIRYYLFKKETSLYVPLGNKPPFVEIRFGLVSEFKYYPTTESTFKNNGEYSHYNGIQTQVTGYLDTIPVYKGEGESEGLNWILPVALETTPAWQPTYSIEGASSPDGKTDVAGIKHNWTMTVLGCYNKFIAEQTKDNKFVFPFYLRYAYELYDGSLIMHSYPILMIPNSRGPIFALDGFRGIRPAGYHLGETYESVRITTQGRTYGFASTLMHQIAALSEAEQTRLENWKDLIRGINIYVTPPIYNYNQGGQVLGWHSMSDADPANDISSAESTAHSGHAVWDKYYTIGKVKYGSNQETQGGEIGMKYAFENMLSSAIFKPYTDNSTTPATVYGSPDYCMTVPQKDMKEWLELHENAGQFYKLAEIDYETLLTYTENGMADGAVPISKRRLNTISNQDIMQDDNGSHDTMSAEVLYEYNRRLNMAKVNKQLHSPLALPTQWAHDYTTGHSYHEIVHVNNGGLVAELRTTTASMGVNWPQFIFYPGTNAKEAIFIKDGSTRYIVKLKEHKALNGMYWLADFMEKANSFSECEMNATAASSVTLTTTEVNKAVDESNKIYTSETDNPFYVPFGNINIAGGGEVRALAAATTAMSQGQFGQHPMYCFTSEGVWAMTVSDTGGWATIQPVTRDVITAGTKPLSLDSTVVFLGDRGLLQLGGAETTPLSGAVRSYDYSTFSKVASLSDATNMDDLLAAANSLLAFPDVAVLTYDARSGRIYVTPENVEASWVYNLKSGLWTQATTHIDHQVTTYPECEGQQGNMIVEIGGELGYQKDKGFVITRPVKFGDGSVLRRIHELAVRGQFRPYGPHTVQGTPVPGAIQTALWGTRDWVDHALVASSKGSRITRWGGSPYFGHSVGLFITQPADYLLHVVGVDAAIDMEHYNKLR